MRSYDFERLPSHEVRDYAEHGTPGAQSMAKELLLLRSHSASCEAQSLALHAIITKLAKAYGGPAAISDFYAWASHAIERGSKAGGAT